MSTSTSFFTLVSLGIVTKYRRKCITAPMLERLREIAEQRRREQGDEHHQVGAHLKFVRRQQAQRQEVQLAPGLFREG
jgi:hypothetical protein